MSRIESATTIEKTVGAKRHQIDHLARAVSVDQRVYILHSQDCLDCGIDLRECEYSQALDLGIDMDIWEQYQDEPVVLSICPEGLDLLPEPIEEQAGE